ncbi:MAG: hypothetical protein ACREQT_09680 [Candidatus Binataceae bacterium]
MNPYRLPVSGFDIHLRQAGGREDLMLLEASALDMALAIALLENVASRSDEGVADWAALPVTDVDAALLRIRQNLLGDLICTDLLCPAPLCGKRIDVKFSIGEFLAHHAPSRVRGVGPAGADNPGWFRLADGSAMFRLPTGEDIIAAAIERSPERELIRRCIRPAGLRTTLLRRALRAIETMAPSLSDELAAECAECGAAVRIYFDARSFALRELQGHAAFIYGDTHLLAHHYHWPEADILALPRDRRIHYVEMLRQPERGS